MYGRRRNLKPLIIVIVFLLIGIYYFLDARLESSIMGIAISRSQLTGQQIISRAIIENIANKTEYQDLMTIHKDSEGRIVLMQPNTVMINRMMAETLLCVEEGFINLERQTLSIPSGQMTGSKIFAGYGPEIKVRMVPVGKINVEMNHQFEDAGINQTHHLISLTVKGSIKVIVPFNDEEVDITMKIPITENIVVGQVPDTYLGFSSQSKFSSLFQE